MTDTPETCLCVLRSGQTIVARVLPGSSWMRRTFGHLLQPLDSSGVWLPARRVRLSRTTPLPAWRGVKDRMWLAHLWATHSPRPPYRGLVA